MDSPRKRNRKLNDLGEDEPNPMYGKFDEVVSKIVGETMTKNKKVQLDTNKNMVFSLPVIQRKVDGELIPQRAEDGYVNATAMCQATSKQFGHYRALKSTQEFLDELAIDIGIPMSNLIVTLQGRGNVIQQGTWVHPDVAVHLAQWCSPKFAVAVSRWVREWMTGSIKVKAELPYHLKRYLANRSEIPPTHFSILNELTFGLIAPLEDRGYVLPENLVPDISQGKMFCNWLRKRGVEPNDFPTYTHRYEDGREVKAKLYPNALLADFRKHFHTEWIPKKMTDYFNKKDSKALPYLPELIDHSRTRFLDYSENEDTDE